MPNVSQTIDWHQRARDLKAAHRAARALRAGVVYVNCYDADDITVPFGGYKYTKLKTTWIDLT